LLPKHGPDSQTLKSYLGKSKRMINLSHKPKL